MTTEHQGFRTRGDWRVQFRSTGNRWVSRWTRTKMVPETRKTNLITSEGIADSETPLELGLGLFQITGSSLSRV